MKGQQKQKLAKRIIEKIMQNLNSIKIAQLAQGSINLQESHQSSVFQSQPFIVSTSLPPNEQSSNFEASNADLNQNLFKGFQGEALVQKKEEKNIDGAEDMPNAINQKQQSSAGSSSRTSQKNSQCENNSIVPTPRKTINPVQQYKESDSKQSVQISISESLKEKPYGGSGSKPKSKFAKLHSNFSATEQPYIITSSHKSFYSPSKSSANINPKANQPSNFLSPGNNLPSSKKEATSAGNLVQQEENQAANGHTTNISAFGNKHASSQVSKQTTFAALPQKSFQKQQHHSNGLSLYEQVLAKNFEVIDNLLRKLNQIYSNQEDYENSLMQISQKLHKIETDNENIHHEFRTSHFMIDKKLNSITNEYTNMLHDMNLLKKMFKQSGGRGSFFMSLKANGQDDNESILNSRRTSNQRRNSKRRSGGRNSTERRDSYKNSSRNSSQRHSRNTIERSSNWMNLKGVDEQNLGKILLEQINESGSWQGSQSDRSRQNINNHVYYQANSHGSQSSIEYDQRISRTKNNSRESKLSKLSKNGQRISIDNFGKEDIDVLKSYISNQVIKLSENSQINKFAFLGIQSMISKKYDTFEERLEENLMKFKKQLIEERIEKQFRKSIIEEMEQKTSKVIKQEINTIKKELIEMFHKQMQKKCDKQEVRQDLKQILESISRKVNTLMDECYHKFAERNESKRAILFLEKKINKLIDTAHGFKDFEGPLETGQNKKCLSCNKTVPKIGGHHAQSQPMFTQVHMTSPQPKEDNALGNDVTTVTQRNEPMSQTQKRKVKFTDITNLNYVSVDQIFDKISQPAAEQRQEREAINHSVNQPEKQIVETAASSKQAFMKKMKNSQTSDSIHFGSVNSHLKTKIWLNTNDSRPTTTITSSIHEAKNWKSKAASILKKEGADWRSKSNYKKAP